MLLIIHLEEQLTMQENQRVHQEMLHQEEKLVQLLQKEQEGERRIRSDLFEG